MKTVLGVLAFFAAVAFAAYVSPLAGGIGLACSGLTLAVGYRLGHDAGINVGAWVATRAGITTDAFFRVLATYPGRARAAKEAAE